MIRKLTIVASVLAATLIAGVAFAAWTTNGDGTGAASARSATKLDVSAGTPSGTLVPTGSADVAVDIENPSANGYKVHVTSITIDTTKGTNGFAVDADHSGCNLSSLSYTTQNNGGLGWDINSGATLSLNLANAISMSNSANDSCQGASFTVYLHAAGASAA